MYCSKCGKQLTDKTVFCPYCGNMLKRTETHSKIRMRSQGRTAKQTTNTIASPSESNAAGSHPRPRNWMLAVTLLILITLIIFIGLFTTQLLIPQFPNDSLQNRKFEDTAEMSDNSRSESDSLSINQLSTGGKERKILSESPSGSKTASLVPSELTDILLSYMGPLVNAQVNYFRMDTAAMSQETSCADDDVFWNTFSCYCNANISSNNGSLLISDSGYVEISEDQIIEMAYALFNDFDGKIPQKEFSENGAVNYDSSRKVYKFMLASMHDYIYVGRTPSRQNQDGTFTVTYLYKESYWANREGPQTFAYDISFRNNNHMDEASMNPYYYTIESIERKQNADTSTFSLFHIDIADYLEQPESLAELFNARKNNNDNSAAFNNLQLDISEYLIEGLSFRTYNTHTAFKDTQNPDFTISKAGIGDSYPEIVDILNENNWSFYSDYQKNEYGSKNYAFLKKIGEKEYLLSLSIDSNNTCTGWETFSFTDDLSSAEKELLKRWFDVPSDVNIIDYSKSKPGYWNGADTWTTFVTITFDNGAVCGAEVDPITFEPLRAISNYTAPSDTTPHSNNNSPSIFITEDVLNMTPLEAAKFLGMKNMIKQGYVIFYTQEGHEIEDGTTFMESFEEYEDTPGLWNLFIYDNTVTFLGLKIGMSYSEAEKNIEENGWNYELWTDSETGEEEIYGDKSFYDDREIYLTVSLTNGKVSYIGYVTEGD